MTLPNKSKNIKLIKILIFSKPASTPSSNGGDDIPQVDHEADPDHSIQDQGNFQSKHNRVLQLGSE